MDLAIGGGFWRTNLRCRRWVLVLCFARTGGAGGVCSSAPRVTKRSCLELKHVHADPPRQVASPSPSHLPLLAIAAKLRNS